MCRRRCQSPGYLRSQMYSRKMVHTAEVSSSPATIHGTLLLPQSVERHTPPMQSIAALLSVKLFVDPRMAYN